MINNFIIVLRNGTLYSDRKTAISNLNTKLSDLQDGEICIASYGASWEAAKTILGVVRFKDSVRSYTIFDNEANSAEIAAEIAKLDNTVTHTDSNNHVTVKVIEADGLLSSVEVTTADIASAALLGTTTDTSAKATAFGYIKKEAEDRDTAITAAVKALDSSVAATASVDGKVYSVLTGVTQADGKLTEKTEVTLAAVAKTGSAEDVAKAVIPNDGTYATVEGENVSEQIASIAKTIKGITTTQSNAFKYITVKLSDTEVTGLSDSNVKEAYKVVAYIGESYASASVKETVGDIIKIYKDATIKEIYLGNSDDEINTTTGDITRGQIVETKLSLNYAYIKADGTYAMASIPVGNFLRQSEFKNGLQVAENGEVSVKVDSTSETFLTVGEKGVKLSGVQGAIDTAIQGLDATIPSTGDNHVSVTVAQTDGKVSGVTVTTTGLALDSEVIKGVTVNGVDAQLSAEKKATVTIDGADIAVADSYTATVYSEPFETKVGTANHIAANDKISEALKKTENTISVLANEVIANEKVTTAAVSKLAESAGVAGADGVIGYQKKTDANYISAATSVHDATVKLDAAIKTVEGNANNALTEVQGGNAITVSTKASNSQTVSLKLDTTKDGDGTTPTPGANALTVNANGLYLSNVWDCGEY